MTYIVVSENEIVRAEMERPGEPLPECLYATRKRDYIYDTFQYEKKLKAWEEHCLSLPRIQAPGHKWKLWSEVELDKDFILSLQFLSYDEKTWIPANGRTESGLHYIKRPYRTIAIPIQPTPEPVVNGKEKITLEDLPAGSLFKYNETIALKSEYRTENGTIEAFIVGSGEMFWGGTTKAGDLRNLMVIPLDYSDLETLWRDIDLILDFADFNDSQKIKMIKDKVHSFNKKIKL